jgi:hypothetical protein
MEDEDMTVHVETRGNCKYRAENVRLNISVGFDALEEAQSFKTERGGPVHIIGKDGHEWMLGAYANRQPQWFQVK